MLVGAAADGGCPGLRKPIDWSRGERHLSASASASLYSNSPLYFTPVYWCARAREERELK